MAKIVGAKLYKAIFLLPAEAISISIAKSIFILNTLFLPNVADILKPKLHSLHTLPFFPSVFIKYFPGKIWNKNNNTHRLFVIKKSSSCTVYNLSTIRDTQLDEKPFQAIQIKTSQLFLMSFLYSRESSLRWFRFVWFFLFSFSLWLSSRLFFVFFNHGIFVHAHIHTM